AAPQRLPNKQFFQSPLHRGRYFNRECAALSSAWCASFSPLFIGEGTSTAQRLQPCVLRVELSVPSSSGKVLQQLTSGQFDPARVILSVPSSSGKVLQQVGH